MISDIQNKIMSYIPYDYADKINTYLSGDNLYILILIIYSAMVSMYTPRSIINLINQPVARFLILGLILYTATYNILLAIFISIAFIITVSIDTSIIISKTNLKPIYDFDNEGFVGTKSKDNKKNDTDDDDEEDIEDDEKFENQSNNEEDDEDDNGKTDEEFINHLSQNTNLNDTFKDLHNAIHKLETFISTNKK
jgi:hypothetical protein